MEIVIKTKFGIGDEVFAYYNGGFSQFKVTDIYVGFRAHRVTNDIVYACTAVIPEDCEVTFTHEYQEEELYTKDRLIAQLEELIK